MMLLQSGSLRVLGDRSGDYAHKNGYSSGIIICLGLESKLKILLKIRVNGSPWHYDASDNSWGYPLSVGDGLEMVISYNWVISFPNKEIFDLFIKLYACKVCR